MIVKPTCFIAMAFGREDTDLLYENLILPVLKGLNINPIIINRQEKNDDLNFQIIEELKACDFAIADLTYARPSVYFEAGFAQRAVEVIYTVREDHLNRINPDELRVHFDLQMKPLITWSDIEDQKFSRELSRRIAKTFLQKWNHQRKEDEQKKIEEEVFHSLPQESQVTLLRKKAIEALSKKKYKKWMVKQSPYYASRYYNEDLILQGVINNIYSLKKSQSETKIVSINSFASATKSKLADAIKGYNDLIREIIDDSHKQVVSVSVNHLIFSIRIVPDSRIRDILTHYSKVPDYSIYSYSSSIKSISNHSRISFEVPIETNFLFISNITRPTKFEEDLTKFINIKQL